MPLSSPVAQLLLGHRTATPYALFSAQAAAHTTSWGRGTDALQGAARSGEWGGALGQAVPLPSGWALPRCQVGLGYPSLPALR